MAIGKRGGEIGGHGTSCYMRRCWFIVVVLLSLSACTSIGEFMNDSDGEQKPIPREDCNAHLSECLGSPLQSVLGGTQGRSVCVDCHEICRGQQEWPDVTGQGKDCQWWHAK